MTLLIGAVARDPKVVTIWSGFRGWFAERRLATDFVLYSHYERQVEDLVAGHIHLAWNTPLAWVRAQRLAAAQGVGGLLAGIASGAVSNSTVVMSTPEMPSTSA